ncbi:MAG: flavodoxin/nitric oxide synthase [Propionicimonas sp.]|nr:flavodoxin/nitric oxide synthase [Propionicimonas sp.]
MSVLIVVESEFGNTRRVAQAIADGVAAQRGADSVHLLSAGEAPLRIPAEVSLVVAGAPTHNLGLPTQASRAKAAAAGATGGDSTGLAEWIAGFAGHPGLTVTTFDTRVASGFAGSAAKAAYRALHRRIGQAAERGPSFIVKGTEGPLADGELEHAAAWGAELARRLPPAA